ncbi:transglutaminase-like domain-containing protein [Methanobacterium alcaliphilum]|uniref:transglutaminase-like domain-containing protein n=1 Tax=Methanobacterium alcaliphilum TaxID=392018 RepID=UPI00200AFACF|nr:transglutaminase family protein [Methanobacterium alcaliphilum]MCK9150910.1 transglutaminase family protein [Methanobacterium alcaliphilum]
MVYFGHGGGRIKGGSLIAILLLFSVALVLPIDEVNAVDSNNDQLSNNLSSVTQKNLTTKTVSTKSATTNNSSLDIQRYTYYVKVPYKKVKVRVTYWKKVTKTIKTPMKQWYYSSYHGKYKYRYVYKYKYVNEYKKSYKWVKKIKYKKVAKVGYFHTSEYLKSTDNCEIHDDSIQELSKNLTNNTSGSYEKADKIFKWVRNNLKYSFYYNTKKGAVKTLSTKSANCCDHSHLVIALARAAKIPARYVHGKCVFSSGNTYGHVWAQLFINGKWYDADATSYKNTLGTIKNWNKETVKIKGHYIELPF